MREQASQMSIESMEDCWSENVIRPARTCWRCCSSTKSRDTPECDYCPSTDCASDDVSLHSCNSTTKLKHWNMVYPVDECCERDCRACDFAKRRRRRQKRRKQQQGKHDASDSDSDSECSCRDCLTLEYADCQGQHRRRTQPVICATCTKPCTLVSACTLCFIKKTGP